MANRKSVKKDKKGREEEWQWEETPEVKEALARLRATELRNRDIT